MSEIYLLPNVEWDVLVFDHVSDLAPHCKNKENDPVTKQYRPEYRNIKYRKECHYKRNAESLGHGVPTMAATK